MAELEELEGRKSLLRPGYVEIPDQSAPVIVPQQKRSAPLFVSAVVILALMGITALNSESALDFSAKEDLQPSFSNHYTVTNGNPGADYPWINEGYLVEPHKPTKLSMGGDLSDISNLEMTCEAKHIQSGDIVTGTPLTKNTECSMMFSEVGDYVVANTLTNLENQWTYTSYVEVRSRYVRRDIRKLGGSDLSAYLDAARTLYDVSTEEGQSLYGSNYKDMAYFTKVYVTNSVPDKQHDRFHDGMGFLSQHIALTNEYEASLQAVNKAVALPYWDFTQDMVMIKEKAKAESREIDYKDLWSLDIWTEDYFGTADTTLHTVTEGRWAYTRVPKQSDYESTTSNDDDDDDNLASNPYGYMRAPWNLNPSPYVTRYHKACSENLGEKGSYEFNQWPTCKDHYYASFDISSYGEFVYYMSYDAHGGVHRMIGGSGGDCDDWSDDLKSIIGEFRLKNIEEYSTFFGRFIYREDICTMPSKDKCIGTGQGDGNGEDCRMFCSGCDTGTFTSDEIDTYSLMFESFGDATTDQKISMITKVYCDSKILVGEQIEASSAVDVTFWPIHPALERLLQYRQLVNPLGDYEWDGVVASDGLWNSECMWGKVFDTTCTGHGETDIVTGKSYVWDEDAGDFVAKYLTNQAFVEMSKPEHTWKLPYVYATFDHEHCEKEGIYFEKVPETFIERTSN
mmetsp:Transcript_868/g.1103  ORF Transcript_868/g.1103 Transcript_868/m.1103 type:complete len:681 (-) Transcript_868:144-2186(-)